VAAQQTDQFSEQAVKARDLASAMERLPVVMRALATELLTSGELSRRMFDALKNIRDIKMPAEEVHRLSTDLQDIVAITRRGSTSPAPSSSASTGQPCSRRGSRPLEQLSAEHPYEFRVEPLVQTADIQAIASALQNAQSQMRFAALAGDAGDLSQAMRGVSLETDVLRKSALATFESLTRGGLTATQAINEIDLALQPFGTTFDDITRKADVLSQMADAARTLGSELVDVGRGFGSSLVEAAGRAVQAIQAVLSSVHDVTAALAQEGLAKVLGLATGIGGVLAGVGSLLGGLFTSTEGAAQRAQREAVERNTQALHEATNALAGLSENQQGTLTGQALDVLGPTLARLQEIFRHLPGFAGRVPEDVAASQFDQALSGLGLTFQDLEDIAQRFGITLVDQAGNIVPSAFDALREKIQQAQDAIVTFGQSLGDQSRLQDLFNRIFQGGNVSPADQLQQQIDLFQQLAPQLFGQFGGAGLGADTEQGRQQTEQFLQRLLDAIIHGQITQGQLGQLTFQDLEDLLGSTQDALDQFKSATDSAAQAVVRFTDTLADQRSLQDLFNRIFKGGEVTPAEQVQQQLDLFRQLAPALFQAFGGTGLAPGTGPGNQGVEQFLQRLLDAIIRGQITQAQLGQLTFQDLEDLLGSTQDALDRFRDATDSAADATNAVADAMEELTNVPRGFKREWEEFLATFTQAGHQTGAFGGASGLGSGGDQFHFNGPITVQSNDPADFARQARRKARQRFGDTTRAPDVVR
jgi:hypothetical protein